MIPKTEKTPEVSPEFEAIRNRADNHDFMTDDHIAQFLRNHKTGTDNLGRQWLAKLLRRYDGCSVLDAACGTCVNFEVFRNLGISCEYTGLDRTPKLLAHADALYKSSICEHQSAKFMGTQSGYVQHMPFQDNSFDVVILRHILEHLPDGYEQAIAEAWRVAKKEVMLVFFLTPTQIGQDNIEESQPDDNGCTYFWNTYSWPKLTEFLSELQCRIETHWNIITYGAAHADTIVRIFK